MGTGTLLPVEEYLRRDYSPDCDYVDGRLEDRNVGGKDHGKVQKALLLHLAAREKDWGIFVIQEQRLQISPSRFRVPDICVVAGPEPEEQIFTRPPFLCVEILSPDDRVTRMQERIDDYLAFGVSCVWLIDPETRRAWIHTADRISETKDGILRARKPDGYELSVRLDELL